jgi:hypothetical protein
MAVSLRVGKKGDQVGQILRRELFVESRRHYRDSARAHLLDLIARHADRFRRTGHEHHFVRRARPFQSIIDLAALRHDLDWLVTADETCAGKQDRFEQVSLGTDGADFGQVGANTSPLVSKLMTRDACCLRLVEHALALSGAI